MIVHVRLNADRDADIIAWYEAQPLKSDSLKTVIREHIRLHNGDSQEAIVRAVVAGELARLPDVVASAVRSALAGYRLADASESDIEPGSENPVLAGRLDAELDAMWGE